MRKTDPKKLTRYDQQKKEEIEVESIKEMSDEKQAELIADKFSEVSLEYDSLTTEGLVIPDFEEKDIPQFTVRDDEDVLKEMD